MSNAFTKLGQFLGIQEEEGFEGIGGSLPFNLQMNDTCILITILFIIAFVYKKELIRFLKTKNLN